ncbi:hypothetical protein CCGE531_22690 (plasmid) [Rhizobium sp. CCGE531]|nr:hypothetical protein CCGE531_22690 [Rhizobium sp. CCGE531]
MAKPGMRGDQGLLEQAADRSQFYISWRPEHFRMLLKQGILTNFGVSAFLSEKHYLVSSMTLLQILLFIEFRKSYASKSCFEANSRAYRAAILERDRICMPLTCSVVSA